MLSSKLLNIKKFVASFCAYGQAQPYLFQYLLVKVGPIKPGYLVLLVVYIIPVIWHLCPNVNLFFLCFFPKQIEFNVQNMATLTLWFKIWKVQNINAHMNKFDQTSTVCSLVIKAPPLQPSQYPEQDLVSRTKLVAHRLPIKHQFDWLARTNWMFFLSINWWATMILIEWRSLNFVHLILMYVGE